jgi:hypothetical protein
MHNRDGGEWVATGQTVYILCFILQSSSRGLKATSKNVRFE